MFRPQTSSAIFKDARQFIGRKKIVRRSFGGGHNRACRSAKFLLLYWMFCQGFVSGIRRLAMSAMQKPEVLFVLGGPGSGKGTTCSGIKKTFGCVHLSAGDLLREERANSGSEYGELIEGHIRNGTIVPVEITCSLLERAMNSSDNPHKRFLIDGFPRNQDNVDGWTKVRSH